jgi:hypothetical protein
MITIINTAFLQSHNPPRVPPFHKIPSAGLSKYVHSLTLDIIDIN